jgi:phage-related protein
MTLPLPNKLADNQCSKRRLPRTLLAQFGDGYSQRAPDGINNIVDEWDITWIPLNHTDKNTVTQALDQVGGWGVLTWTPPGDTSSKKFIMTNGYTLRPIGRAEWVIATTLHQVFDV